MCAGEFGRRRRLLYVCGISLAVSLAGGLRAQAEVLAAEQALEKARVFAEAVGLPFGEGATAVYQEPGKRSRSKAEWEIRYHRFSLVYVEAESGQILSVVDFSAPREPVSLPDKEPIAEEAALSAAEKVMAVMQLPAGAVREKPVLVPKINDDILSWVVRWRREAPGAIPYHNNFAKVELDAGSGRLVMANVTWTMPPPPSLDVSVSKEEAIAVASEASRARAEHDETVNAAAQLEIVQPDQYWSETGPAKVRWDTPARLAWVVTLERRSPDTGRGYQHVFWVDAQDKRILGGTRSGGPSRRAASDQGTSSLRAGVLIGLGCAGATAAAAAVVVHLTRKA